MLPGAAPVTCGPARRSGEPTSRWAASHKKWGRLVCDRFWKAHREGKPGWSFQIQFCKLGGWEMKSFCMFCGRTKKQEEEFHFHCRAAGRKPSIIFNLHVFVCLHFWGSSSSCSFSCPFKAGDGAGRSRGAGARSGTLGHEMGDARRREAQGRWETRHKSHQSKDTGNFCFAF